MILGTEISETARLIKKAADDAQHAAAVVAAADAEGITLYFDGSDTPSGKKYLFNAGVTFAPGDRVILDRVAGTWIVAYKIGGGAGA